MKPPSLSPPSLYFPPSPPPRSPYSLPRAGPRSPARTTLDNAILLSPALDTNASSSFFLSNLSSSVHQALLFTTLCSHPDLSSPIPQHTARPMSATPLRHHAAPPSPAQTAPPAPAQQSLKRRRSSRNDRYRPRDTSIVDQPQIYFFSLSSALSPDAFLNILSPLRSPVPEQISVLMSAPSSFLSPSVPATRGFRPAAMDQCFDSPNNVISCWPVSSSTVAQHEWATFTEAVNIYLFQADSGEQVLSALDVPNPLFEAGSKHFQVNDSWWGSRGNTWNGQNVSFPMYFVITRNDRPLDNSAIPQATFTAVPAASRSSASAASLSSVLASESRASASAHSSPTPTSVGGSGAIGPNATSTASSNAGSVQGANSGSSFPKWAIAVIVVLGFLALVASGILAFYIARRFRRRRDAMLSHRNSMGSSTPMMSGAGGAGGPQSPVLGPAALAAAGAGAGYGYGRANSPGGEGEGHDGASMTSRASDTGPISVADAAIMANAFRHALRKPDFADRPMEEGESPDDQGMGTHGGLGPGHSQLINQELAEEGRDIRSVSSSRGVKVETLSGADDDTDAATVQDH
ncbi:hypothetical protein ACG7TL_006480 [Trametes sanguinea]